MKAMDDLDFAIMILNERKNKLSYYSPLSQKINCAIAAIEKAKKMEVKVAGGRLAASAIPDENYPGLDISFIPDHDSVSISLAVVEQCQGKLRLCSYMDTQREDPDIIDFQYDAMILQEVAYHHYIVWCEDHQEVPVDYNKFKESLFHDYQVMKDILPSTLLQLYISNH